MKVGKDAKAPLEKPILRKVLSTVSRFGHYRAFSSRSVLKKKKKELLSALIEQDVG